MDGALLQAFVYLAAAVVSVPVAKRLGLGSVLGYLIAGALIGPFALHLVGDQTDVMHAAEFGVVILLFLIGLEVRPALLWSMRGDIFGLGAAQVGVTAAALACAALLLGVDPRQALAAGLILAMSSTAIVLQMLEENGLRRRPSGRAAFGVLLFQDLAVIPLLAFLPLLAAAGSSVHAEAGHGPAGQLAAYPAWVQGIAVVAAVIAVVVAGRFLIRPLFRYIARAELREVFTAAALMIVVGVALLMQTVGLSPALGAFLAGVVLAESEFRRELETDIEPFRGLLLGLFFITVGAGLNVPLVLDRPIEVLGVVAGLMAVKALVLFGLGLLGRLSWRDAGAAAISLSQGGEFAFVLLTFAVGARVLGAELASLLTASVALSMAATPLAFALWKRLSRTRAAAVDEPDNEPFDQDRPPDAIVAGFGRFGQIVARVLIANGFSTATLESSVEQIALLRRFGRRVYYGDATRLDLLRAAGADKAKLLVVAIDDKDKATDLVEAAREAFPNLKILARAFDRRHAYDLLEKGADVTERETFEGGLAMASEALRALGWRAYRAERAARLFRRHDERMFHELRPLWGDTERYRIASRESSPRMEDLLSSDLRRLSPEAGDDGWDVESLYAEARALEDRENQKT